MSRRAKAILSELSVACELTGTNLSAAALAALTEALSVYPEDVAINGIRSAARSSRGPLTIAKLAEAIEAQDGRPNADEAWALCMTANDETATVVWTPEMSAAFFESGAANLLDAGDKVAARMAFRGAYERALNAARERREPVVWQVSPGSDAGKRERALLAAVAQRRMAPERVAALLPHVPIDDIRAALPSGPSAHALTGAS